MLTRTFGKHEGDRLRAFQGLEIAHSQNLGEGIARVRSAKGDCAHD